MKFANIGTDKNAQACFAPAHASRCATVLAYAVIGIGALAALPAAAQTGQPDAAVALSCDDRLAVAMERNTGTKVLLVKSFKKGDSLVVSGKHGGAPASAVEGTGGGAAPVAKVDLCLVKLLVGPGNPGPAQAPSTSAGIGIEVLLPSHSNWNQRIRAYGNSGWSGTPQANLTLVASDDLHVAAAAKGFVVATSDNGHVGSPIDPSFAMKPDGSINTAGWQDFSERSLHELAEKTKILTKFYYGRPHQFAYWDGFSTGGRQALKLAQQFPKDFDGILAGAPAINWSKYHTAGLYARIAMQQDLGHLIAPEKLSAATNAAIKACGGAKLGFLVDPLACRYDPVRDTRILCKEPVAVPARTDDGTCLSAAEAKIINKAWYGQTTDGSVPSPASDNGNSDTLEDGKRLWFGWTRDTDLKATPVGGAPGIILAADQTALELQRPELGSEQLKNATGNGANLWLNKLDYAGLANAQVQGVQLQPQFSRINTDNPDLAEFAALGGKLLMYHGLSDEYIPVQGSLNYYTRVMAHMGGGGAVAKFFRFYLIPGFTHSGRSEGKPSVPVPQPSSGRDEMFVALQNWVERGKGPGVIQVRSSDGTVSLPLCVYPLKTTYRGTGSVKSAGSYSCR